MTPSSRPLLAAFLLALSIAAAASPARADALAEAWTRWTRRPPESVVKLSADVRALSQIGAERLVERGSALRSRRLRGRVGTLFAVVGVLALAIWQLRTSMRQREHVRLRLVLDAARQRDGGR